MSIRSSCRLAGLSRSHLNQPRLLEEETLRVEIRRLAYKHPRFGYRRIHALLKGLGWQINVKRVRRIWREEGLQVRKGLSHTGFFLMMSQGIWDIEWFAKAFFPEHCRFPFSSMHDELFQLLNPPKKRGQKTVIAAPRGHAKTTLMLLIQVAHAIYYGHEPYIGKPSWPILPSSSLVRRI